MLVYETQYDERFEQQDHYRSQYPIETQGNYNQTRPFPEPLGRRPESFEDRLPERDSWMQSNARANQRPVPLDRQYAEREMWIEQKEDYRFDQYGNRLPDRLFQPAVPRPYRSRM